MQQPEKTHSESLANRFFKDMDDNNISVTNTIYVIHR